MSAPTEIYSPGLEGVIAGETALSTIVDGLSYRGYPVTECLQAWTALLAQLLQRHRVGSLRLAVH